MDKLTLLWAITVSLFIGSLGFPVPENPLLVSGGYAIFKQTIAPGTGPARWFGAVYIGDIILYALSYGLFTHSKVSASFIGASVSSASNA